MGFTPSRIVLISRGRIEEVPALGSLYPGMLGLLNSSGQIIPHNLPGGAGAWGVLKEDALRGADITQVLPTLNVAPFVRPAKGDLLLMLLQNGQNVPAGASLMSAGDGTLIQAFTNKLYEIVAPSAVITNLAGPTVFSNGSFPIPANSLQVGDVINVRLKAFCIAVNSTNTHDVQLTFGPTPTIVADAGARILAANDVVEITAYITIRTITASGTIIADGILSYSISGTITTTTFTLASTAFSSVVANTVAVQVTVSAASAGNQIRLDEFEVNLNRSGGVSGLVTAFEAINNSGGTGSSPISGFNSAAFIRCLIP